MAQRRVLVLASGSRTGGGSGFEKLVEATRTTPPILNAEIVAVVSNHQAGGVRERAARLDIPFVYMSGRCSQNQYEMIARDMQPDLICLSGWLKFVEGLDPTRTINIHPGPLPRFGGKGMYGHHVHEAVMAAYHRGEIRNSMVAMHYVAGDYDAGPTFLELPVPILPDDTAETLGARVNACEHQVQAATTESVLSGAISWDGVREHEVVVPEWYLFSKGCPERLRQ